jgi:CO dehydrogenase maturation factor
MRVAFMGKGGAGKSSIAGTFARLLAARGEPVLAIDSDPMPGLAISLGLQVTDVGLPDEAIHDAGEGQRPRYRLPDGLDAVTAVERYTPQGPDGVRFLQFGNLRGHAAATVPSQMVFRQIIHALSDDRWHLVGDLPAGTRQAFYGWGSYADTVLVVVEPSAKSILSGRRLARLSLIKDAPRRLVAVANKVQDADDVRRITERTGLEVVATIPRDEALETADRLGRPLLDVAPDSKPVEAVASLIDQLQAEEVPDMSGAS